MQKQPTLFVLVQPKGFDIEPSEPRAPTTSLPTSTFTADPERAETGARKVAGEEIRAHRRYCRYHHDHREYRCRRCEWWR